LFGWPAADVVGRSVGLLVAGGDGSAWLPEHPPGAGPEGRGDGGRPARQVGGVRRDGTLLTLELSVSEVAVDDGLLYTAIVRDVGEHNRHLAELSHQATHDPLTGLPNRA